MSYIENRLIEVTFNMFMLIHALDNMFLVSITDESTKPWIDGTDTPIIAQQQAQLACCFIYSLVVNPTFKWFLADKQLDEHLRNRFEYANGTAAFRSVLLYNFTVKEDQQNLTCSVSVEGEKSNRASYRNASSLILNIHCM